MYEIFLLTHNFLRGVAVIVTLLIIIRSLYASILNMPWKKADTIINGIAFLSYTLLEITGLILYTLLSPVTHAAFSDFSLAMKNDTLRFFTIEHTVITMLAIIIATVAFVLLKRIKHNRVRFVISLFLWTAVFVFCIMGIPWWRPLIPYPLG